MEHLHNSSFKKLFNLDDDRDMTIAKYRVTIHVVPKNKKTCTNIII